MPKTIYRLPRALKLLGTPQSSAYAKNDPNSSMYDPSFPRIMRVGPKSVGIDSDEILRYQLLQIAKHEGVPEAERDKWIDDRFIEERAREEMIAEARERLQHKPGAKALKLVAAS